MSLVAATSALIVVMATEPALAQQTPVRSGNPFLIVLGTAQDAGYPQAGTRDHRAWERVEDRRHAASLGLVDPETGSRWMFEATPDFKYQLHELDKIAPAPNVPGLSGIFLTHAHIGHYAGLIHIGHEVMGAKEVPVYAMPRMGDFLRKNGPWDQLVRYHNIKVMNLAADEAVRLNKRLAVTPFRVPHRDEYSETVGYRITGPNRTALFLPDIDKWEIWDTWGVHIEDLIQEVDLAFLDASFFADGELPGRDMSAIKHPYIVETMERFKSLGAEERNKVWFIHMNHTNPALFRNTDARRRIEASGFHVADELLKLEL